MKKYKVVFRKSSSGSYPFLCDKMSDKKGIKFLNINGYTERYINQLDEGGYMASSYLIIFMTEFDDGCVVIDNEAILARSFNVDQSPDEAVKEGVVSAPQLWYTSVVEYPTDWIAFSDSEALNKSSNAVKILSKLDSFQDLEDLACPNLTPEH